jgi:hypothetical protein
MKMPNKKALELSVNALVTIIIAIVILSLGIVFLRNFFKGAGQLKANIDEQTESQIASLLAEGEPVAVPVNRKTVSAGKHTTFGIGILNIIQDSPETTFNVDIRFSGAYDRLNNRIDTATLSQGVSRLDPSEWLLYDEEPFVLAANDQKIMPILIRVAENAVPGTYIFTVDVLAAGADYGKHKIYVEVP